MNNTGNYDAENRKYTNELYAVSLQALIQKHTEII